MTITPRLPSLAVSADARPASLLTPLAAPEASSTSLIPVMTFSNDVWNYLRNADALTETRESALRQKIEGSPPTLNYMLESDLAAEGYPQVVVVAMPKHQRRDEVYLAMGLFSQTVELAQNPELEGAALDEKLQRILNTIPAELGHDSREQLTNLVQRLRNGETLQPETLQQLQDDFINSFPDGQVQNVAIQLPAALEANPLAVTVLKALLSAFTGGAAAPFLGPIDYATQTGNYAPESIPADSLAGLPQYDPISPSANTSMLIGDTLNNTALSDEQVEEALGSLALTLSDYDLDEQATLLQEVTPLLIANRETLANASPAELTTFLLQVQLPNVPSHALRLAAYNPSPLEVARYEPVDPEQTLEDATNQLLPHTALGMLASLLPTSLQVPGTPIALGHNFNLRLANQASPAGAFPEIPWATSLGFALGPLKLGASVAQPSGLQPRDVPPEVAQASQQLAAQVLNQLSSQALDLTNPDALNLLLTNLEADLLEGNKDETLQQGWAVAKEALLTTFAEDPTRLPALQTSYHFWQDLNTAITEGHGATPLTPALAAAHDNLVVVLLQTAIQHDLDINNPALLTALGDLVASSPEYQAAYAEALPVFTQAFTQVATQHPTLLAALQQSSSLSSTLTNHVAYENYDQLTLGAGISYESLGFEGSGLLQDFLNDPKLTLGVSNKL